MSEQANSDELSMFVTSTLKAIAIGIADAQAFQIASAHGTGIFGYAAPDSVEFDIAVSARNSSGAGGGLKIAVFGIGADGNAKTEVEQATVSRIKFAIPTHFRKNPSEPHRIPSTVTARTNR